MDRYRETTEAEDARHNTPPIQRQNPFLPEGMAVGRSGLDVAVRRSQDSELSFSFPWIGGVFKRIGRIDSTDFDNVPTVDLMVLQAHLEAAMSTVRRALEADHRR